MKTATPLITLLSLLLVSSLALAQDLSKTKLGFRSRKMQLVLTSGRTAHVIKVDTLIGAAKIDDARLLFIDRREEFIYLLVDVGGSSKLRPDEHQCGGGEERNLLWLKLTSDWKLSQASSVLYLSCWQGADVDEAIAIEDGKLRMRYDDYRENVANTVTYDSSRPEAGLVIDGTPLQSDSSGE
jgi:hypothetical protein